MNDTDSLLVFRLKSLKTQPKTVRGRCIVFYASLNHRPVARVLLATLFALVALAHSLWFVMLLKPCLLVRHPSFGPRPPEGSHLWIAASPDLIKYSVDWVCLDLLLSPVDP